MRSLEFGLTCTKKYKTANPANQNDHMTKILGGNIALQQTIQNKDLRKDSTHENISADVYKEPSKYSEKLMLKCCDRFQ